MSSAKSRPCFTAQSGNRSRGWSISTAQGQETVSAQILKQGVAMQAIGNTNTRFCFFYIRADGREAPVGRLSRMYL